MKACSSGRAIEIEEVGGAADRGGHRSIVIRFPFDVALVATIRALPGRRFDTQAKCWRCPLEAIVVVVDTLAPLGFSVAPDAFAHYVANGGTRPPPEPERATPTCDDGPSSNCSLPR